MDSAQNSATCLASSTASISSCNEQLTGHAGHDIKCPIVCGTAPHLHSKPESSMYPHLNRFSLLRPTWVRSLFKDFQVTQGNSCPGGRSSAGGTNGLGKEALSLHSVSLSCAGSPVSGTTHFKKLFRLLSLCGTRMLSYKGCRVSETILALSLELATALRTTGGAIPASGYSICIGVGFRQPVMIRHVSFKAVSTSLAWAERLHTGHAYSPAEKDSASPVVRITSGEAPHLDETSRRSRPLRVCTFCLIFLQFLLNRNIIILITSAIQVNLCSQEQRKSTTNIRPF